MQYVHTVIHNLFTYWLVWYISSRHCFSLKDNSRIYWPSSPSNGFIVDDQEKGLFIQRWGTAGDPEFGDLHRYNINDLMLPSDGLILKSQDHYFVLYSHLLKVRLQGLLHRCVQIPHPSICEWIWVPELFLFPCDEWSVSSWCEQLLLINNMLNTLGIKKMHLHVNV